MDFQFDLLLLAAIPNLGYGPIAVLIGLTVLVGAVILLITHTLPKAQRKGHLKDDTYEAGMETIGDARRRFNVKFYLVAVMFLIFDVELVFLYPWAVAFIDAKSGGTLAPQAAFLFWVMFIFFTILTLGFLYEWGKGILNYD